GSGSVGDIPLTGDLDGDGRSEVIVWRSSTGDWFWITSSSGYTRQGAARWGGAGDIPLVFASIRNTGRGMVTTPPPPLPTIPPTTTPTSSGTQLRVLQWNTHHG